ncbi:hypothetical protein Pgy4_39880, partial [Pseudomonas savastanoi pv. glycinea str. race 4]
YHFVNNQARHEYSRLLIQASRDMDLRPTLPHPAAVGGGGF